MHQYTCEKCRSGFTQQSPMRKGRRVRCEGCRRRVQNNTMSNRTWAKILKRIKASCSICGWNKAPCDIHHIKQRKHGGSDDAENLAILCPNCHREAHNNKISTEKLRSVCLAITHPHWKDHYKDPKVCKIKPATQKPTPCKRPTKEILELLVFEKPTTAIAKDFGVSDKAVEKWCKHYNLTKPGRGYWAKKHAGL